MAAFNVGDRVRDYHGKDGIVVDSRHATGDTVAYEVREPTVYHANADSLTLVQPVSASGGSRIAPVYEVECALENALVTLYDDDRCEVAAFPAEKARAAVAMLRSLIEDVAGTLVAVDVDPKDSDATLDPADEMLRYAQERARHYADGYAAGVIVGKAAARAGVRNTMPFDAPTWLREWAATVYPEDVFLPIADEDRAKDAVAADLLRRMLPRIAGAMERAMAEGQTTQRATVPLEERIP